MLRSLWEFDYLWEVYVPEAKRHWGYYVLPVLFGDRLVGRIEPRLDRKKTLNIALGIWFQARVRPSGDARLIPGLREAIEAYRSFVDAADTVTWPRTRVGRAIAGCAASLRGGVVAAQRAAGEADDERHAVGRMPG